MADKKKLIDAHDLWSDIDMCFAQGARMLSSNSWTEKGEPMREKLIKLLYHASCESELEGKPGSCPYRKHGRCGEVERLDYCAVQHLADHLIANGVTFCDEVEDLKATVVHQRKRADTAETFICTMCSECDYEVNDGILTMQKRCCSLLPLECGKFKPRPGWIPVTERLPEPPKEESKC